MICEGRKYVINDNAGIFCDITQVPENLLVPGDDYVNKGGFAIGMLVNMADVEIPVTLCLTDDDAKALIKALKMTRKKYRKITGKF